jgi:hypothetical protein
MGNKAALATAKSVMASAKRLIDVRHSWRSSSRMAEISVPACPIPIHHTKLVISKAHPTGALFPQTPTPFKNNWETASRKPMVIRKAMKNPTIQPSGVRLSLLRGKSLTLFVTDA